MMHCIKCGSKYEEIHPILCDRKFYTLLKCHKCEYVLKIRRGDKYSCIFILDEFFKNPMTKKKYLEEFELSNACNLKKYRFPLDCPKCGKYLLPHLSRPKDRNYTMDFKTKELSFIQCPHCYKTVDGVVISENKNIHT